MRQGGEGCVWETLLHCVCWGWFGGPALPVTVRLSGFRVAFNKFKQLLGGKSAFRSSFKCSRAVQGCVSWPLLGCVGWGRFGGHALGVTVRLSGFDIFFRIRNCGANHLGSENGLKSSRGARVGFGAGLLSGYAMG